MRVIITAATAGEWGPFSASLNPAYTTGTAGLQIRFHASGVGMLTSAFSITKMLLEEKPDLVVQAGIAGCFDPGTALGSVFAVKQEILADTGVEENGSWNDLFDLKLENANRFPFCEGKLPNPWLDRFNLLRLPVADAVTVNQISVSPERIRQISSRYTPGLESMEGAVLHYACGISNIPFLQLRAVSNYIGERNKANWKIKEAIGNLNQVLTDYADALHRTF
ncbi:futalosine hydrolase [Sediminibacterium ginsengisoli]|uniref:Futalosine hydrolase n=1 Tax=Sediminibacterium ginsengisoli TaxID=413434 RepID=A0A1T4MZW4_9BACT|nr:futalosine hydrolase [Sediminibacterium ginsengisoli]SJZ72178.1 futalosine hydrolase [Sediminibacterium ginsengisoli]